MVNSPEEYQYMQVLPVLHLDVDLFCPTPALDDGLHPMLPLDFPSLVSYIDIKKFVNAFGKTSRNLTFKLFFEAFQPDPARSGGFYHDPARWHAFAATRFLRFLAAASSR